jgi:hypothetical protein
MSTGFTGVNPPFGSIATGGVEAQAVKKPAVMTIKMSFFIIFSQ